MEVVSGGSLDSCSFLWVPPIGDGAPVECTGGINESLGGPNCDSSDIYLVLLRFALLLVLTHLSLRLYSARLGHFYCKYLHVGVYYQGAFSGHRHMHRSSVNGMHSAWQL